MKGCELCRDPARIYCEADGASLCWDCDEKVHSANFLVAKHSRSLLCYACQSPTPWSASGTKLTPTVSVCPTCLDGDTYQYHALEEGEDDCCSDDNDVEQYYSSDDDDDDGGDRDDVADYQVVPWSSTPSQPPPLVACSSSSSSEEVSSTRISSSGEVISLNPRLENADRDSQDGFTCTSSTAVTAETLQRDKATSSSSGTRRPLKKLRRPN